MRNRTLPSLACSAGLLLFAGPLGAQVWELDDHVLMLETLQANGFLGHSVAIGDFDGDDYGDIVVGAPYWNSASAVDSGIFAVFVGGPDRAMTRIQRVLINSGTSSRTGWAVTAGDFDADGCDDLAVGAPFRTVGGAANAGAVEILSGSVGGVVGTGRQILTDQVFGYTPNVEDFFGSSLAAGNFNTSAFTCIFNPDVCYEDLAIGVPGQFITNDDVGQVMVACGGAAGIRSDNETYLEPASVGAAPELNDRFGHTLAAGRLDDAPSLSSSYSDLATGTVNEDFHQTDDGYVHLLFGASGGVDSAQQEQPLDLKPAFNLDPAADYDHWGWAMAIGDLDGCGVLVVGVPHKDVAGESAVGVIEVLYGALFADGFESQATVNW